MTISVSMTKRTVFVWVATFALALWSARAAAADYQVSSAADFQAALSAPLAGGDRILLAPGVYAGTFVSSLNGAGTPITITSADLAFPARIDGSLAFTSGGWVTVTDLEFFNSNTNRTASGGPDCIDAYVPSIVLLHNVIHDCSASGIGLWSGAANSVAYGNLIYYVGWNGLARGHGHGMYIQSTAPAWKLIENNIVLNVFGWGLHSYTEGGHIDNITYRDNTVAMSGSIADGRLNTNFLTGGLVTALNPVWDGNVGYYPLGSTGLNGDAGYSAGWTGGSITNNRFVGGTPLELTNAKPKMRGNDLVSKQKQAPSLTVVVRSDQYEPGRAVATVINIGNKPSASVPVAALGYANGEPVAVVSAEDPFGPVRVFTVVKGAITLPLTGWTVASPIGWPAPATTLPSFGAFVLSR
jgi:hypothetical protein